MGDRCYLEMEVVKNQAYESLRDELAEYFSQQGETEVTVSLLAEEANYAYYDELDKWANRGIIASGSHGAGGSYAAQEFILVDGKVFYAAEDGPTVVLKRDQTFCPASLKQAQDYWSAYEKFMITSQNSPAIDLCGKAQ